MEELNVEESKALAAQPTVEEKEDDSWRKLCFQDGIWHKWIVERLDDAQKETYLALKERVEAEGNHFSIGV